MEAQEKRMTNELPPLRTERLLIRPLELSDMNAVHGALSRAWNEGDSDLPESRERDAKDGYAGQWRVMGSLLL
jgi:hypothetical protein